MDKSFISKADEFVFIESQKSVTYFHSPFSGEIFQINRELFTNPSLLNTDPLGMGWIICLKIPKESFEDQLTEINTMNEKELIIWQKKIEQDLKD